MRPIALKMAYFGPFESAEIDFRTFDESPIFLISGDTGAGKSTILDAMTYALFGSTSGSRKPTEVRSQFANPNQETQVIFHFEQGNQLYRVTRKPEQMIMGARKLKKQAPQATLAIVDGVEGQEIQNLGSKPKEVNIEITQLLKLNHDQFKKIILLPQNDFSRFLKDSSEDKKKILKKIFGTEIFENFKNQVKARYQSAEAASKLAMTQLDGHYSSTVWSEEELAQLATAPDAEKLATVEAILERRRAVLEAAQSAQKIAQDQYQAKDQAYQSAQRLAQTFIQLDKLKVQYQTEIVDRAGQVTAQEVHLAQLNWASQLASDFDALDQTKLNLASSQEKLSQVEARAQKEATEKAQKELVMADLDRQASAITALKEKLKVLPTQITLAKQAEAKQAEMKRQEIHLTQLKEDLVASSTKESQLSQDLASIEGQIIAEQVLQSEQTALAALGLAVQGQLTNKIQAFEAEEKKASQTTDNWLVLTDQLPRIQANFAKAEADLAAKQADRRLMLIAQLQADLQLGEACPVCGALEHPITATGQVSSDQALIELIERVATAQKNYDHARQALISLETQIETAKQAQDKQASILERSQRDLTATYAQLRIDFPGHFSEKMDWAEIQAHLKAMRVEFKAKLADNQALKAQAQSLQGQLTDLVSQMQGAEKEIAVLERTKVSLADEVKHLAVKDSAKALMTQEANLQAEVIAYEKKVLALQTETARLNQQISATQGQLKVMRADLLGLAEEIQVRETRLNQALAAEDAKTSDLDEARDWAKAQADILTLSTQVSHYQATKVRLETEMAQLQADLAGVERPDLSVLESQRASSMLALTRCTAQASQAQEGQVQAEKEVVAIEHILAEQAAHQVDFQAISQLYQTMFGKSHVDKLDLETYVVQNYLDRVLRYANTHFINHFSNHRYQFELAEQGRDRRSNHGLDINVYDNETGESRSADTLSGGETFVAALSIALALSEVVQNTARGVHIDALFIDEGFGSLDQETLQKAIEVLEKIGQNRLVGLISHVEEMKANIAQQLVIKKKGSGRSRVTLRLQ